MSFCGLSAVILAPRTSLQDNQCPKAPATVVYKPLGNVSENHGHSGCDYTNCALDILCLVLFRIAPSECATYITHLPETVPISPVERTARSAFHLCGWPLVWRQACLKRSRLCPLSLHWASHLSSDSAKHWPAWVASCSGLAAMSDRPSITFSGILRAHLETTYYIAVWGMKPGHLRWTLVPLLQELFKAQS